MYKINRCVMIAYKTDFQHNQNGVDFRNYRSLLGLKQ